jgi:hypothetical protein
MHEKPSIQGVGNKNGENGAGQLRPCSPQPARPEGQGRGAGRARAGRSSAPLRLPRPSYGLAVVSSQAILPLIVSAGTARYPEREGSCFEESFRGGSIRTRAALQPAWRDFGRRMPSFSGALSRCLDLPQEAWLETVASCRGEGKRDLNRAAFQSGRSMPS